MELLARTKISPTVVDAPRRIAAFAWIIRKLPPTSVRTIPSTRLEAMDVNVFPREKEAPIRRDCPITFRPPPDQGLSDSHLVIEKLRPNLVVDTVNALLRRLQRPRPILCSRSTLRSRGTIGAAVGGDERPYESYPLASSQRNRCLFLNSLILQFIPRVLFAGVLGFSLAGGAGL